MSIVCPSGSQNFALWVKASISSRVHSLFFVRFIFSVTISRSFTMSSLLGLCNLSKSLVSSDKFLTSLIGSRSFHSPLFLSLNRYLNFSIVKFSLKLFVE
jgi:hypothetical protein